MAVPSWPAAPVTTNRVTAACQPPTPGRRQPRPAERRRLRPAAPRSTRRRSEGPGLPRPPLPPPGNPLAGTERTEALLQMERNRVIHLGPDAAGVERLAHGVARGHAHDVL